MTTLPEPDYKDLMRKMLSDPEMEAFVKDIVLNRPLVFESADGTNQLHVSGTAVVNNALFNLSSGNIEIGDWVFFGHGVQLLTGTHDVTQLLEQRQCAIPANGRDIVVRQGAWISSGVIVIGPCTIGEHAVVAAGSVVTGDVPPCTMVGGVPARPIKRLPEAGKYE
jgi:acetyltransferase-like isoleucine patch superfamily enzyme